MSKVAVLGFGVVGSGVAEILTGTAEGMKAPAKAEISLKYILDIRDFPESPFAECFVKDFSIIENDPEVDIVVETIGGMRAALEFTERALKAGKSVITSNKELVANHGRRLMQIAKENGGVYLFEASTGGGIPVLRPMSVCMAGNDVNEICGIVNGTCNYIFTRMIQDGVSFEDALKGAQANGYAEQDPTADIEGHDTCRKLCILSSIATGWHLLPEQVPTEGITKVTLTDAEFAGAAGYKIKLLARVRYEDGKACPFTAPHLIPLTNPLSGVDDVFNAVLIRGNLTGDLMFYGKGAGKLPTAAAVVADIAAAAGGQEAGYAAWEENRPEALVSASELKSRWYIRIKGDAAPDQAEEIRISGAAEGEVAYILPPMTRAEAEKKAEGSELLSIIRVLE